MKNCLHVAILGLIITKSKKSFVKIWNRMMVPLTRNSYHCTDGCLVLVLNSRVCLFFCLFLILFYFLTLQYCIGFAIYRNESATGIHEFPILNPPPSSLPIPSLWIIPVHQPQASSIVHRTWIGDSFHIWYYTYFNAILPNHPTLFLSHRVKRLFYTSVSLLLSRIQGYCYHLSKFHIYALVYCIGVFPSGLLHSV